jgi:hypothetical protein
MFNVGFEKHHASAVEYSAIFHGEEYKNDLLNLSNDIRLSDEFQNYCILTPTGRSS